MSLILRDSINPFDIPLDNLAAVAGYGDGIYQWSSDGWARFQPPIVPLSIVVNAADAGDVLDVEFGAASPGDCPGWADRFQRSNRRRPTIYCSRSLIAAVRRMMNGRSFDWWAATLDGTVDVPGAVAVQYCGAVDSGDPCRTAGHYDESVILDPGWIGGDMTFAPGEPLYDALQRFVSDLEYALIVDEPPFSQPKGEVLTRLRRIDAASQAAATQTTLQAMQAQLAQIVAALPIAGGALTAAQAQQLDDISNALSRIEQALQHA